MLKKSLLAISILTSISGMAVASDVDFYGYMRAGVGTSADSGSNVSHEKARLGRLGNENDVYGEIGLGKEVYNEDGKTMYVDSMIAVTSDGSNDWEDTNGDDANIALRQFNVQAKGFLDFAPEATLWAGKQYYQRQDIHISDFFYWSVSGAGAGIENIDVGGNNLSIAWVRGDSRGSDVFNEKLNINILDVRYAGIDLGGLFKLELGVDYAMVNDTKEQNAPSNTTKNGTMLTAVFVHDGFFGGDNKTVFQYGSEGYGSTMATYGDGLAYNVDSQSGSTGYRVINTGLISPSANWDFSHQILFGSSEGSELGQTDDITTLSLIARPVYKWNKNHKTMLEAGYYTDTDANGEERSGSKFTLAQAWTAGESFYARPEIRAFVSYVQDDNTIHNGNLDKNHIDNDISFGVQAEVWW